MRRRRHLVWRRERGTGGGIRLLGSSANQALLNVTGTAGFGAAGTLRGYVRLAGDSAIEFASGEITRLANDAQLHLYGNDAFIEDGTALGSNSALTGLASIGRGARLDLEDGASVSTTGSLVNDGDLYLDVNTGDGGSSLTVGGTLTNSHYLFIGFGYFPPLSAPDVVTAAAIDNTGVVQLLAFGASQALLDVTSSAGFGAAGVLSGNVYVSGDSAIEFASGEITRLAANSSLELVGSDAFVQDRTALGSNSALTGLSSIGANAFFDLENGAAVPTTGGLVNDHSVLLDINDDAGGSSLTVAGALTSSDYLGMGNTTLSASDKLTVASLDNTGTIQLLGHGANFAALNVSGATTNKGSFQLYTDTEELAGAVDGKESFSLSTSNLQFNSSVSAGQTITEAGADALTLEQAQNFHGTISGFGAGDTIDAANSLFSGTTLFFVENSGGTEGTLTLHDGGLTANIPMTGDHSASDFTRAPDSGTGTLVKYV
jgi:hypothetical protein